MKNIFEKANKKAPKKSTKHEVVDISNIEKDLKKILEIDAKLADLADSRSIHYLNVCAAAKEAMINIYNSNENFPGTLQINAGKMTCLFVTTDKYKKIDEDRYNELVILYGKDIVEKDTVFSFNTAILMKYKDHISKLLASSKVIAEEDKANLLNNETSYNVKKGIIKNLFAFLRPLKIKKVNGIIENIQPEFSIKSIQTI
jgi:hypothetical protein